MDSADSEVSGVSARYRGYREEFQKMINTREIGLMNIMKIFYFTKT